MLSTGFRSQARQSSLASRRDSRPSCIALGRASMREPVVRIIFQLTKRNGSPAGSVHADRRSGRLDRIGLGQVRTEPIGRCIDGGNARRRVVGGGGHIRRQREGPDLLRIAAADAGDRGVAVAHQRCRGQVGPGTYIRLPSLRLSLGPGALSCRPPDPGSPEPRSGGGLARPDRFWNNPGFRGSGRIRHAGGTCGTTTWNSSSASRW